MTQQPSPMERQGALVQELGTVLLASLDPPADWRHVGAAFLPHGTAWAGRFVITAADDAVPGGGDAPFAEGSRIASLLDELQSVSAEEGAPLLSLRLDLSRPEPERIALGSTLNRDRDPGDLDGLGGVDAQVAQRLAERFGLESLPGWVRDLLP